MLLDEPLSSSLFAPESELLAELLGDELSSLSKLNPNELFPRLNPELSELSPLLIVLIVLELVDGVLDGCCMDMAVMEMRFAL